MMLIGLILIFALPRECGSALTVSMGYSFEKSVGNIVIESTGFGLGNNGQNVGAQRDTSQKIRGNASMYFDGVDSYLDLGDYRTFPLSGYAGISFSLWIRPKDSSTDQQILGHSCSTMDQSYTLQLIDGKLRFTMADQPIPTEDFSVESVSDIPSQQWTHVAIESEAENNRIAIFINGTKESEMDDGDFYVQYLLSDCSHFVGISGLPGTTNLPPFNGWIDDLQYFNGVSGSDTWPRPRRYVTDAINCSTWGCGSGSGTCSLNSTTGIPICACPSQSFGAKCDQQCGSNSPVFFFKDSDFDPWKNCATITADLWFTKQFTGADAFSNLSQIAGGFYWGWTRGAQMSLSVPQLQSVTNDFGFLYSPNLINVTAVSLSTVNGWLFFWGMTNFLSSSYPALSTANSVIYHDLDAITTISGYTSAFTQLQLFQIESCPLLNNIDSLSVLQIEDVSINDCPALEVLDLFPNAQLINGDFSVKNLGAVTLLKLNVVQNITGSINVEDMDNLVEINFPALLRADSLYVASNTMLTTMSFPLLESLNGVKIAWNPALTTLHPAPSVTVINDFIFIENGLLTDILMLPNLITINGNLHLEKMLGITSISGLKNLKTVLANIEIWYFNLCDWGFEVLEGLGGSLDLEYNSQCNNIRGFNLIFQTSPGINVLDLEHLTNLTSLNDFYPAQIRGLYLEDLPLVTNLNISKLLPGTTYFNPLYINLYHDGITIDMTIFDPIQIIDGPFGLYGLIASGSVWFPNLQTVNQQLIISDIIIIDRNALFPNLTSVGYQLVIEDSYLSYIPTVFPKLTSIGNQLVFDTTTLNQINSFFIALQTVGSYLQIISSNVTNINTALFPNLTSIQEYVEIRSNSRFINIGGSIAPLVTTVQLDLKISTSTFMNIGGDLFPSLKFLNGGMLRLSTLTITNITHTFTNLKSIGASYLEVLSNTFTNTYTIFPSLISVSNYIKIDRNKFISTGNFFTRLTSPGTQQTFTISNNNFNSTVYVAGFGDLTTFLSDITISSSNFTNILLFPNVTLLQGTSLLSRLRFVNSTLFPALTSIWGDFTLLQNGLLGQNTFPQLKYISGRLSITDDNIQNVNYLFPLQSVQSLALSSQSLTDVLGLCGTLISSPSTINLPRTCCQALYPSLAKSNPSLTITCNNTCIQDNATCPVLVPLIYAPSQVSSCQVLTLDGSASYGFTKNNGVFLWSVKSDNDTTIIALRTLISSNTGPIVTVPSSLLIGGTSYQFSLTISDKNTSQSSLVPATVSVQYLSTSAPNLEIFFPSPPLYATDTLTLTSSLTASTCYKIKEHSPFQFYWTLLSPVFSSVTLNQRTQTNSKLIIPPRTLSPNVPYTFQVRVTDKQNSIFIAQTTLTLTPLPLVAKISGPLGPVPSNSIILDGTLSYNPNRQKAPKKFGNKGPYSVAFSWYCSSVRNNNGGTANSNQKNACNNLISSTKPIYNLSSLNLPNGKYNITLLISTLGVSSGTPTEGSVQLVGSSITSQGTVKIYSNQTWRTICSPNWNLQTAQVICRQLGYESAIVSTVSSVFDPQSGVILNFNRTCSGEEMSLFQCPGNQNQAPSCTHANDVGVICGTQQTTTITQIEVVPTNGSITVILSGSINGDTIPITSLSNLTLTPNQILRIDTNLSWASVGGAIDTNIVNFELLWSIINSLGQTVFTLTSKNFALPARTLAPERYQVVLAVTYLPNPVNISKISFTLQMNNTPPISTVTVPPLAVTPLSEPALELNTLYVLRADGWWTPNPPLKYSFSLLLTGSTKEILLSDEESAPFISIPLPAGDLNVFVDITDINGVSSRSSLNLSVPQDPDRPLSSNFSATLCYLNQVLTTSLADAQESRNVQNVLFLAYYLATTVTSSYNSTHPSNISCQGLTLGQVRSTLLAAIDNITRTTVTSPSSSKLVSQTLAAVTAIPSFTTTSVQQQLNITEQVLDDLENTTLVENPVQDLNVNSTTQLFDSFTNLLIDLQANFDCSSLPILIDQLTRLMALILRPSLGGEIPIRYQSLALQLQGGRLLSELGGQFPGSSSNFSVPSQALDGASSDSGDFISIQVSSDKILSCYGQTSNATLPPFDSTNTSTVLVSNIVDASMYQSYDGTATATIAPITVVGLPTPIVFNLPYQSSLSVGNMTAIPNSLCDSLITIQTTPLCQWWDGSSWRHEGCVVSQLNITLSDGTRGVQCSCNHLTEFALFLKAQRYTTPPLNTNCSIQPMANAFSQSEILAFLVFASIYAIIGVLSFVQLVRILKSGAPFGFLGAEHTLVLGAALTRGTLLFLYSQWKTSTKVTDGVLLALLSSLPIGFNFVIFTFLVSYWAAIYHFSMQIGRSPFQKIKIPFIIANISIFSMILVLLFTMGLVTDLTTKILVAQIGEIFISSLTLLTALLFVFYGTALLRVLRAMQQHNTSNGKSSLSTSVTVGLFVFSIALMGESIANILLSLTLSTEENQLTYLIAFYALNVIALFTIIFIFYNGVSALAVKKSSSSARASSHGDRTSGKTKLFGRSNMHLLRDSESPAVITLDDRQSSPNISTSHPSEHIQMYEISPDSPISEPQPSDHHFSLDHRPLSDSNLLQPSPPIAPTPPPYSPIPPSDSVYDSNYSSSSFSFALVNPSPPNTPPINGVNLPQPPPRPQPPPLPPLTLNEEQVA